MRDFFFFFFSLRANRLPEAAARFNEKYLPLIDIHAAFKDSVSERHPGDVNLDLSKGSKSLQRLQTL